MELGAAGLVCERHGQQPALGRRARDHRAADGLEVLARFFLGVGRPAGGEPLQAEGRARRVAHVAARVAGPFFEEERLHSGLERFVVERGGWRSGWALPAEDETQDQPHGRLV